MKIWEKREQEFAALPSLPEYNEIIEFHLDRHENFRKGVGIYSMHGYIKEFTYYPDKSHTTICAISHIYKWRYLTEAE